MSNRIDLHIHTTYSDGLLSPSEILDVAREKKLAAIALCDHDNYGGFLEINEITKKNDPEIIAGVELSTGQGGEDIHILGYMFNPASEPFKKALENFRERRNKRGEMILSKLKEIGIDIPLEMVQELAGNSAIGRPNIADAILKVGAINRFEEAFEKYIGIDGPAYVPKENLTPKRAIELIHDAGGLAFLAHPGVAKAYRYIDEFTNYGLDGIEIHHPYHNSQMKETLIDVASKKSLLKSGGSDSHGREKHHGKIGTQPITVEWLDEIKNRYNQERKG